MPKTRGRPDSGKSNRRPTTVYLEPDLAKAAKLKSVATGMSVSDQMNEALVQALQRDERHLRVFEERRGRPTYDYDKFIAELKRHGRL